MIDDDRAEYLAWAKRRALEYLDAGLPPAQAHASFGSDLNKRDDCPVDPEYALIGLQACLDGPDAVRRWIMGYQPPTPKAKQFVRDSVCPFCGSLHTRASATANPAEARAPVDGDVTLCFACGELAVFDAAVSGGLRKPTTAEYDQIAADSILRHMHHAWTRARDERERQERRAKAQRTSIIAASLRRLKEGTKP